MRKIAVIGAGKTGRGFVGRLLAEAGADILFVDQNEALVRRLNGAGGYTVRFFGDTKPPVRVEHYTAATWETADFAGADLCFVAVGGGNLPNVGERLGRLPVAPRYIVTCENAKDPAAVLRERVPGARIGEATVFCTTVEDGDTDIRSEDYPFLQYDADALGGFDPGIAGIRPVARFGHFLTRKLYTYNAASCVIAYLGAYYGFTDYGEAANDPRIDAALDANYAATGRALCAAYGYDPADQAAFADLSKKKFQNRAIIDSIARNARDPARKLSAGERLAGPLRLLERYHENTAILETTVAALLCYRGDEAWNRLAETRAPADLLRDVAGIGPGEPLGRRILARYAVLRHSAGKESLFALDDFTRTQISLNGVWDYRIGGGAWTKITVPYSARPVGVSTCALRFDAPASGERAFLLFDGITYAATVTLNGIKIGEMRPYRPYRFEVTGILAGRKNRLEVEIRDIGPAFGPSNGWENFGGIIRDVRLEFTPAARIADTVWQAELSDGFGAADCTVTVETENADGCMAAAVLQDAAGRTVARGTGNGKIRFSVNAPLLWSPDTPYLYTLHTLLLRGGRIVDARAEKVGIKSFTKKGKRFCLNGEPIFLVGVCRHDLYGDKGHTADEDEMRRDMLAIKRTGANYVRLVHYPHHPKILELADELGLLVSEEPGLWWSDLNDPAVCDAALDVLRATVRRDRNHVSVAFWLSFNECVLVPDYLRDSAALCRAEDPTRMVSGANCMTLEQTRAFFPESGFDFYTMHPYAPTTERLLDSAKTLTEMPLLLTEWGGYFCAGNDRLFREFIRTILALWQNPDGAPVLAGAAFWCWADYPEFRRADGAENGRVTEGLVDEARNPKESLRVFTEEFAKLRLPPESNTGTVDYAAPFAFSGGAVSADLSAFSAENTGAWAEMLAAARCKDGLGRYRPAEHGPVLPTDVFAVGSLPANLLRRPLVLTETPLAVPIGRKVRALYVFGNVSFPKGFPSGGIYGEPVAIYTVRYADGYETDFEMRNGTDITTADAVFGPSRINPTAENSPRALDFSYAPDWERYIVNLRVLETDPGRVAESLLLKSAGNGYVPLIYGVTAAVPGSGEPVSGREIPPTPDP